MSKPVEPPKKSPRRPCPELQAAHKIDLILSELSAEEADRVLMWLMARRDLEGKIKFPDHNRTYGRELTPPLSDIGGD